MSVAKAVLPATTGWDLGGVPAGSVEMAANVASPVANHFVFIRRLDTKTAKMLRKKNGPGEVIK